jgi:hypothetical protein
VLSIGVFFSLMIAGLASTLPTTLTGGLTAHGVPYAIAHKIGQAPPVASLFAAFLGYNPVHQLLAPTGVLAHLSSAQVGVLTGKQFFPQLISGPFHHGLVIVFSMAMVLLVIAAFASVLRGGRYVHEEAAASAVVSGQHAARAAQQAAASDARMAASDGHTLANGGQPGANSSQPRANAGSTAASDGRTTANGGKPTTNGGQPAGDAQTARDGHPPPASDGRTAANGQPSAPAELGETLRASRGHATPDT